MKTEISMNEWIKKANEHNNSRLDTMDEILANLKKDKNYYNHGMTEQMWLLEQNRAD